MIVCDDFGSLVLLRQVYGDLNESNSLPGASAASQHEQTFPQILNVLGCFGVKACSGEGVDAAAVQ